jgi:hypothetical protein
MAASGPVVAAKDGYGTWLAGRVSVVFDATAHQSQVSPEPVEPESDASIHVLLALCFRGQLLQPGKLVRDARQGLALRIFVRTCVASDDDGHG